MQIQFVYEILSHDAIKGVLNKSECTPNAWQKLNFETHKKSSYEGSSITYRRQTR